MLRLSCLEVAGESKMGSREMGSSWSRGLHEFISITIQRFQLLSFHYLTHHSLRLPEPGAGSRFSILFLSRFKAEFVN